MAALAVLPGFVMTPPPAAAQTGPVEQTEAVEETEAAYRADPLGLIAWSEMTRAYTADANLFAVWVCDTPARDQYLAEPAEAAESFATWAQPYFGWLSEGRYSPEFLAAHTVTADDLNECDEAAEQFQTDPPVHGAVVAGDTLTLAGLVDGVTAIGAASFGATPCGESAVGGVEPNAPCQWPRNDRTILLGAIAVVPVPGVLLVGKTLAHEIGHALGWPHSFHSSEGEYDEYDNLMDLMSGSLRLVGTPAVNRYAAGWIPPEQVAVHPAADDPGPGALYDLAPVGRPGLQMLVLPTGRTGVFYTFETRVQTGYDEGIPVEGVEAYLIDQTAEVCDKPWLDACWGLDRRTQPLDLSGRAGDVIHVFTAGEDIVLGDTTVRVLERSPDGSGYSVWVGSGPLTGAFFDDDGSVHEAAIDWLAATGLTQGCDRYRYCPVDRVTRAQAAAFVARAANLVSASDLVAGFADVAPAAWYASHLSALVEAGVVAAGGRYRPAEPVTRAELAVMLARALGLPPGAGGAFDDVVPGAEAEAAAALAAAGITRGCSAGPPARFCPDNPVTRAQMASLLMRALA